jgi:hypothetical protein
VNGQGFFKAQILEPSEIAKRLRTVCGQCGAGGLIWTTVEGLALLIRPDQLAILHDHEMGRVDECWWCPTCSGMGLFQFDLELRR